MTDRLVLAVRKAREGDKVEEVKDPLFSPPSV